MTFMLIGLVALAVMVAANVGAFAGARYAIARAFGVPGAWRRPSRRPAGRRVPVAVESALAVAGPVGNYLLAAILVFAASMIGPKTTWDSTVNVAPSGAAAAVGLESGDRIVSIAGVPIDGFDEIRAALQAHANRPLEVVVDRAGKELSFMVTPVEGRIGVSTRGMRQEKLGVGKSLAHAATLPARRIADTTTRFVRFITGTPDPDTTELSAPAAIVREVASLPTSRIANALMFVAMASAGYLWVAIVASVVLAVSAWRRRAAPLASPA